MGSKKIMTANQQTNEVVNDTKTREEIATNVLEDYYAVEKSLTEDGYYTWKSAKSANRGYAEQSHLQHVRNGVDFLVTLYKKLPSNTPFFDEMTLRRACAAFVSHDYHKRKEEEDGYDKQFEIPISDADKFIESCDLKSLAPTITPFEIRGIMAAHHEGADNALHDSVPESIFDAYYLVLAADAIASTSTVEDAWTDVIQQRITSALGNHDYTVHTHTVNIENDVISSILNGAISDVLFENEGWLLLRQYDDGCIYLSTDAEDIEMSEYTEEIYDAFHDKLADSHIVYADDTVESNGLETMASCQRWYDVSRRDVYYQGTIDAAVGVMQRALRDAEKNRPFQEDEKLRIKNEIEPYIETEIQTETRHISGLARGIKTLYISFISYFTDEDADTEWKQDNLLALMKIFEVDTEENVEEILKLREENGDRLEAGTQQWTYKYLISQYIYDKYYDGRGITSIKKTFRRLFEAHFSEFENFESYESEIGVEKIHDEVSNVVNNTFAIDGESDTDTEISAEKTCEYCNANTSASEDGGQHLLKSTPEIRMKTEDGVISLTDETTLCYMCQLEVETRQSHDSDWANGDEDAIYAHYGTEFGYIPMTWRAETKLRQKSLNYSTFTPDPDRLMDTVTDSEKQVNPWDSTNYAEITEWTNISRGFHPNERFSGIPLNLTDSSEPEDRYNAITATIVNSVLAGVGVHFTKYPMQNVDQSSNEIISFGEDLIDELEFYQENIRLNNAKEWIHNAYTLNQLSDDIGFSKRMETLRAFRTHSRAPGSRLLWMAHRRNADISEFNIEAVPRLDNRYGLTLPNAEQIAQSLETLDVPPNKARDTVSDHLSSIIMDETIGNAEKSVLGNTDSLPYHEVAAQQYKSSLETAGKRDDINSVYVDIADTVFIRLKWQTEIEN